MREDPPCPRAWCGTGDKVCYHPWRGEVDGRKGESEGERPRPKNPIGFRNCDPTHAFPPASIRPCRVTWEGGKGRGDCFWGLFDLSPPLTPFLGLNVFPNPFPSPSPRFVPGFLAFLPPSLREHEFSHLTPSPPRSTSGETEDRNARTISVSQGRGWVARASTNYKGLPGFACVDTHVESRLFEMGSIAKGKKTKKKKATQGVIPIKSHPFPIGVPLSASSLSLSLSPKRNQPPSPPTIVAAFFAHRG